MDTDGGYLTYLSLSDVDSHDTCSCAGVLECIDGTPLTEEIDILQNFSIESKLNGMKVLNCQSLL